MPDFESVADFIETVRDVCLDSCNMILANDENANGDTVILWGNVIDGLCWYYYTDENGNTTRENAKFSISSSIHDGYVLISGTHFSVVANRTDEQTGTSPSIHVDNGFSSWTKYTWNGGSYYTMTSDVNSHEISGWSSGLNISNANNFVLHCYANGSVNVSSSALWAGAVSDVSFTTMQDVSSNANVYLPVSGQSLSYNDMRRELANYANDIILSETDTNGETVYSTDDTISVQDLPDWQTAIGGETESESNSGCCNCTTIYVNADGSLTLQNDISDNFDLSINNEADLSLSVTAAAGAFGAGAVVIDPDAVVNITAGAGSFGAGAFGAGAIVSPDVSVSGNLDIGDISGEMNLQVSEVNFDISGGDVNIDQSGATNNNTYNTTNNYYYDPSEPEPEEPFTIDYGDILSEDELTSILSDETYMLAEVDTDVSQLSLQSAPSAQLPEKVIEVSQMSVSAGLDLFSQWGILTPFVSVAVFSFFLSAFQR